MLSSAKNGCDGTLMHDVRLPVSCPIYFSSFSSTIAPEQSTSISGAARETEDYGVNGSATCLCNRFLDRLLICLKYSYGPRDIAISSALRMWRLGSIGSLTRRLRKPLRVGHRPSRRKLRTWQKPGCDRLDEGVDEAEVAGERPTRLLAQRIRNGFEVRFEPGGRGGCR